MTSSLSSGIAQPLHQAAVISIKRRSITPNLGWGAGGWLRWRSSTQSLTVSNDCNPPARHFPPQPQVRPCCLVRICYHWGIEVARPYDFEPVRTSRTVRVCVCVYNSKQVAVDDCVVFSPLFYFVLNQSPECNNTYFSLYNWTGWQAHLKSADESPSWQWSVWPVTWLEWGGDTTTTHIHT